MKMPRPSRRIGLQILTLVFLGWHSYEMFRYLRREQQVDLFIFRTGAAIAMNGQSPYDTGRIRHIVAKQFPPQSLTDVGFHCGFFLPPQAIPVFSVFAPMEWEQAEIAWTVILTGMAGIAAWTLVLSFGLSRPRDWLSVGIFALLLFNPISQASFAVGQTTLVMVGCFAWGQSAYERGHRLLPALLWAIPFFKPHLALPFLVLAYLLGGWRRLGALVLAIVALNLLGGFFITDSIRDVLRLFKDYVIFLGEAHKEVIYNSVAANPQITSWNRVVVALGGPALELSAWWTLLGYAIWGLACWVRIRWSGQSPSAAYLLALSVAGSLLVCQVLGYELLLLAMLIPWIITQFETNGRATALVVLSLLVFLMIPNTTLEQMGNRLGLGEGGRNLLLSHRCFGVAATALFLLIRGEPKAESPS